MCKLDKLSELLKKYTSGIACAQYLTNIMHLKYKERGNIKTFSDDTNKSWSTGIKLIYSYFRHTHY